MNQRRYHPQLYIERYLSGVRRAQAARNPARRLQRWRDFARRDQVETLRIICGALRSAEVSFVELLRDAVLASGKAELEPFRPVPPAGGWPRREICVVEQKALRSSNPFDRLLALRLELDRLILREQLILALWRVLSMTVLLEVSLDMLWAEAQEAGQDRLN